jgi:hypothetical protein
MDRKEEEALIAKFLAEKGASLHPPGTAANVSAKWGFSDKREMWFQREAVIRSWGR